MSDSGSSSSFTRSVSSAERVLQASAEGQKTGGRLIHTPEDFKRDERRPTRLNGEVVEERKDRDGQTKRIVIRTAQGDIEVERDGSKPLPQKGTKVEIEIQPKRSGHSIQNVIIRTDNTARPAQISVQPPPAENIRTSATPVDVQITSQASAGETSLALSSPQSTSIENVATAAPLIDAQTFIEGGTPLLLSSIDPATLDQNALSAFYSAPQTAALPDLLSVDVFSVPLAQVADIALPAVQTSNVFVSDALITVLSEQILPDVQQVQITLPDTSLPAALGVQETQTVLSEFLATTLPDPVPVDTPRAIQVTENTLQSLTPYPLPDHLLVHIETVALPLPAIMPPHAEVKGVDGLPVPAAEAEEATVANPLLSEAQAGSIQAVITGQAADKLPTMSVFYARTEANQTFMFHAPVDLFAPGTQITFTPIADVNTVAHPDLSLTPVPVSVFIQPAITWPSLNELVPVLTSMNPQVAQVLSSITPNPANPLQAIPSLMLFIAAVRGGDFSTWLGDKTMEIIRRSGRADIMGRIGQEASLFARMSGGPISGDWHGINVPLFWDGEFQKAAFYHRDHEEEGTEGPEGKRRKYTRFIFDLSLSNMGGVQVDGLMRAQRLDIILRTEKMLSQEMQRDMRRVYTQAIGQTEFTGELSFQSDPRKWVTITPDERHIGVEA